MKMFVCNDEVDALEQRLEASAGSARLPLLVELAWHLRQRDTKRALGLAGQAERDLSIEALESPPRPGHASLAARLLLVRGESRLMFADVDTAQDLAGQALAAFTAAGDAIGAADAHWVLGLAASTRGDNAAHDSQMERATAIARGAGDRLRVDLVQAQLAFWTTFSDINLARSRWGSQFSGDSSGLHPALVSGIEEFHGLVAAMCNDFRSSVACYIRAYDTALMTGQLRRAIRITTNIGANFNALNDQQAALEWMQRALDLARPTGWPRSIGSCLIQSAEVLRHLGRFDTAQEMLDEALATLAPQSASRNYASGLECAGDLALDQGRHEAALAIFQQLQERATALGQPDFLISAWRGQAHALSQLGRPLDALTAAAAALELSESKNDVPKQVSALRVLASIHSYHELPMPPGATAGSAPLHYLQQALERARGIKGYLVAPGLLSALAQAEAGVGNYCEAYDFASQASAAHEHIHSQAATSRASALQVRLETERAKAEIAHHRQLAQAEVRRAEVLQQTNHTLAHLSAIGQEITAQLDAAAVYNALTRHVHAMLDVSYFVIYLMEADGSALRSVVRCENGEPLGQHCVDTAHPDFSTARCVRERREILADFPPDRPNPAQTADAAPTASALFAPLAVGDRVLGVMTIQSPRRHAYREREQLVFRSLCAYGAIALSNADALSSLREAQQQLAQQEKLASLGGLVAGVAHELNTPLGVALTAISGVAEAWRLLDEAAASGRMSRQALREATDSGKDFTNLAQHNTARAAALVASFKAIVVPRGTERRRRIELEHYLPEVAALMLSELESVGHKVEFDVQRGLVADLVPDALTETLARVFANIGAHAFPPGSRGTVRLSARRMEDGRIEIVVADSGLGIPPAALTKVFDPFFTTRGGSGGHVGLGLHVAYNHVTQRLGGKIEIASTLGRGTSVTLRICGN